MTTRAQAVEEDGLHREKITLQCVREKGKLRIRFHSFTNNAGKVFTNVYNNSYNCQFPRSIREEGRFFEINSEDIVLVAGSGRNPFYRIKTDHIRILTAGPDSVPVDHDYDHPDLITPPSHRSVEPQRRPEQVFEVTECVICLEGTPQEIFIPCAHLCTCTSCYLQMKKNKASCPLCRRTVVNTVKNNA